MESDQGLFTARQYHLSKFANGMYKTKSLTAELLRTSGINKDAIKLFNFNTSCVYYYIKDNFK